jgi:hypothetical protein
LFYLLDLINLSNLTHTKRRNGPFSVSLPYDLLDHIDQKRGDISRSKFILRMIEKDPSMNYSGPLQERKKIPAVSSAGCNYSSNILLKRGNSN